MRLPPLFKILIILLHIIFLGLVVGATVQLMDGVTKYYAIASLLGLTAFTFMWLHYVVGWIHDRWWPDTSLRVYMKITSWIVLTLILLHPLLLIIIFWMMGLGLPPASYAAYAGREVIFVYAAVIALIGFLLYETRRWLYGKPVWSLIAMMSHMAMLLILMHGWRLGLTLQSALLLRVVWGIYALGYLLLLVRLVRTPAFRADFRAVFSRVTFGTIFILALLFTVGVIGYGFMPERSTYTDTYRSSANNSTNPDIPSTGESSGDTAVSSTELAAHNGKNGAKCWVAVDGVVYQIVSDEWVNGQHLRSNLAYCGADMSDVIKQSPHGKSVLGDQTVIGRYDG